MDCLQILLDSGRGVRLKVLGPSEADRVLLNAAKLVGSDATMIDLKKAEWVMGVKSMIQEVTSSKVKSLDDKTTWRKVDQMTLDSEYDKLFTAKDHSALQAIYRENHEISPSELELIKSKISPVVLGG